VQGSRDPRQESGDSRRERRTSGSGARALPPGLVSGIDCLFRLPSAAVEDTGMAGAATLFAEGGWYAGPFVMALAVVRCWAICCDPALGGAETSFRCGSALISIATIVTRDSRPRDPVARARPPARSPHRRPSDATTPVSPAAAGNLRTGPLLRRIRSSLELVGDLPELGHQVQNGLCLGQRRPG
jgi:hypothetical protein